MSTPADQLRTAQIKRLVADVARAGEIMLGDAQRRAPVDEGTLRGSAELALVVNGSSFSGSGMVEAATAAALAASTGRRRVRITAELSFNTVYAARQHEELDWNHPKGGEAKYLQKAIQDNAGRLGNLIEAGQRAIIRRR